MQVTSNLMRYIALRNCTDQVVSFEEKGTVIMSKRLWEEEISSVNVAVIEDDPFFREQLVLQLQEIPGVVLTGQFQDKEEAIQKLSDTSAELIFIDLKLPDGSGIDIIRYFSLKRDFKGSFVVLTVFDDDEHLFEAFKTGAIGYLLKDEISMDKLVRSIRDVLQGGAPMSRSIARRIIEEFQNNNYDQITDLHNLTMREKEILYELDRGFVPKEIATRLDISYHTVRDHLKNIYRKLHVNSYLEALAKLKKLSNRDL